MKIALLVLTALLTLAACGADGDPIAPAAKSGLSGSDDAQIGVTS